MEYKTPVIMMHPDAHHNELSRIYWQGIRHRFAYGIVMVGTIVALMSIH